jgi:hypothetical protein
MIALVALTLTVAANAAPSERSHEVLRRATEKEIAALLAERDVLRRSREQLEARRKAAAGALRQEIAVLEGRALQAGARGEALIAQLTTLEARLVVPAGARADIGRAVARVVPVAALSADASDPAAVAAAVTRGLAALDAGTQLHRSAGAFFDGRGDLVDGTIVRVGGLGVVAGNARGAGPAVARGESLEIVVDTGDAGRLASALIASAPGTPEAPALLPLWIGPTTADRETTLVERARRAGAVVCLGALVAALALASSLARLARPVTALRRLRGLADRLPSLVAARERAAAEAVCRTAGAPAASVLVPLVRALFEDSPPAGPRPEQRGDGDVAPAQAWEALEADVVDALADQELSARQGAWFVTTLAGSGAALLIAGVLAHVVAGLRRAGEGTAAWTALADPLAIAALTVVPLALAALLVVLGTWAAARLQRRLERVAWATLEVVRDAGERP